MKTPRFFLGAILLFWGWQVDFFWIALILAVILESARTVKTRFELQPSDFNKFVDISTIFLAGTVVIALTRDAQKANLVLLQWLPLIFFPIIATQEVSVKGRMDIKSFFLAARKKVEMRFYETKEIDVSYIYAFFCILSSASANTKGLVYFFSVAVFFVWGLWQIRSRRVPPAGWILCMLIVIILGYEGQTAVRAAGRIISHRIMSYYARYHTIDPFKTYTSIGEIGDLKFSDEIVLRVFFDGYVPGNTYLLHNATYNRFSSSNWFAKYGFERIEGKQNKTFWQVNPPTENTQKMTLYFRLQKEKAVLSVPPGVIDISEMKAGECEKNAMQVIRIEDGPSLMKAVVSYTGSSSYDALPDPDDILIPTKEKPGLEAMAQKLGFENKSEEEILKTIYSFFLSEFAYTLELKGKGKSQTPIENFLFNTKAGHCEFFATATVLLLRQAGIPARYATGFIAHEYSTLEGRLVVRLRDAHAWAKVFVNGQWRNLDTTPASFLNIDEEKIPTSLLEDIFSFFGFKLSQLRHETGAKLMETYGLWLTLPLGLILFLRLRKSGQIKRVGAQGRKGKGKKEKPTGFYRIEEILSQKGFPRYPHETYASWLKRISSHPDNKDRMDHLFLILEQHNQWRFGKAEPTEEQKRKLEEAIRYCLNF